MLKLSWTFLILTTGFLAVSRAGDREWYSDSESTSSAYTEANAHSSSSSYPGGNSTSSSASAIARTSSSSSTTSCTYPSCPPNEHYARCKSLCPPRTCETLDRAYICMPDDHCVPGCQCDAGYFRNALGTCVTEAECRKCPGKNEGWDECADCSPQTCASRYDEYYCPPVCFSACRCKEGYYRNHKGICVPECECDICPENEVYEECPTASCGPLTCAEAGYEMPNCGSTNPCLSEPACICKQGQLRNARGVCIPSDRCPSCGGDENAKPGCGNPCGKSCSDIGRNETIMCPQYCLPNGCDCRKGYVWDERTKKCVKPKDCSNRRCKKNERWVKCPEMLCIPLKCSEVGYPIACPLLPPGGRCQSKARCICIDGYVRGSNGDCIPIKKCPSCGGDKHAVSGCGYQCQPQCGTKVDNSSHPMPCPCKFNGCDCKPKYIYDPKQSKCVLPEQCSTNATATCSVDTVLRLLQQGIAAFTGKFLYEAHKSTPYSNNIMSPMSVFWPMAKLALKANGATYTQLMKVLNLRSKDDISCVFPDFTRKLTSSQDVVLSLADRAFFSIQYPFDPNFVNEMYFIFGARPESLNFKNTTAAAARINEWVASETHDLIKDIAKPEMFDEYTRVVFANAIYFLGNWVDQFNPNNTKSRPFNTSSTNSVLIPTMYREGYYDYAELSNLDCQMVKIFYEGKKFSFVVFLPNSVNGVPILIEKLQNPSVFYTAYNSTTKQNLRLYLPKMKMLSEYNLVEILKKLGVYDVFDAFKSNLTGILLRYEPLHVSSAKQKAFCEVNETGTKAAAANVVVVGTTSAQLTPVFNANRPFIFYILYDRIPIFCGTFVKAN